MLKKQTIASRDEILNNNFKGQIYRWTVSKYENAYIK